MSSSERERDIIILSLRVNADRVPILATKKEWLEHNIITRQLIAVGLLYIKTYVHRHSGKNIYKEQN